MSWARVLFAPLRGNGNAYTGLARSGLRLTFFSPPHPAPPTLALYSGYS